MILSINNTSLVPYLIAEQIVGRENEDAVNYLEHKAITHYEKSAHFRKSLNNPKKDEREVLAMFMHHWLQAFRKTKPTIINEEVQTLSANHN